MFTQHFLAIKKKVLTLIKYRSTMNIQAAKGKERTEKNNTGIIFFVRLFFSELFPLNLSLD